MRTNRRKETYHLEDLKKKMLSLSGTVKSNGKRTEYLSSGIRGSREREHT